VVKALIADIGEQKPHLKAVLQSVLDTPVGPELLPLDEKGQQTQTAEGTVGAYALHDFFLFYTLKYGFTPKKLYAMAAETFKGQFDRLTIYKTLDNFMRRMFSQQFKRSCSADGPAVYPFSLSPRGFFMMPSDASADAFLEDLKTVEAEAYKP
jgi:NAD+ synthase (glutamine-hydrolysing)